MIGRLRLVSEKPEEFLSWDLTENNYLGASSLDELVEEDIGVIAPLSGDYMLTSVYSNFLKWHKDSTFDVEPIIIGKVLKNPIYARNDDELLVFEDKSKIGIYLDTKETGATSEAIYTFLKKSYANSNIEIVEPNRDRVDYMK